MGDLALKILGVACAAGSVWFAAHMFTHQEGGPRINAIEDFAIFAQPNRIHAVEAAVRAAADAGASRKTGRAISIDMTPIGVAASNPASDGASARPDRKPAATQDIKITALSDRDALLETPDGYRRVAIGDEIPEIGKIIAIRRMDEYWILIGSLRSLAQVASPREGGLPDKGGVRP
jgi:hypothetical protein